MELKQVQSSNVDKVGYDAETKTLRVVFKQGDTYDYSGVPQELYDSMLDAASVGGFLNTYIKPNYRVAKTDWVTEQERLSLVLKETLAQFKEAKPNDRSDKDRYYAVVITDLEKVLAYFQMYVANN